MSYVTDNVNLGALVLITKFLELADINVKHCSVSDIHNAEYRCKCLV
jgi:hypothetical protein